MSGPIVRKYGFPNFEKIFGEREIKHGAAEGETPAAASTPPEKPVTEPETKPNPAGPVTPRS